MKILYVITKSNFGGAQRYVFELAGAMKHEGHDVAVALGGSGVLKEQLQTAGIRVIEIKSFQRDINILKEFRALRELSNIFDVEEPDTVHLNSSKAGGLGAVAARIAGIKCIVFTAHGWPFHERRNLLWKFMAWTGSYITTLLAHKTILVSEYDKMHTHMPLVGSLSVIYTSVPSIDFQSRDHARSILFTNEQCASNQHACWLLTNAELTHNKNILYAIDAVAAYNEEAEQKIFYSIIGEGELREELEMYIQKKNADTCTQLLGYIDNVRIYLKAFDAFLLPSKKEGMPYALLEAGAAGLPCIASNVGGIPEIISNKENGLLIDPNNISSLITALRTLMHSPELRSQYGKRLQHKIDEKFSFESMFKKTKIIYQFS